MNCVWCSQIDILLNGTVCVETSQKRKRHFLKSVGISYKIKYSLLTTRDKLNLVCNGMDSNTVDFGVT